LKYDTSYFDAEIAKFMKETDSEKYDSEQDGLKRDDERYYAGFKYESSKEKDLENVKIKFFARPTLKF
jgi:hypothetical protein